MGPNTQFPADLVTFTEEIYIFYAVNVVTPFIRTNLRYRLVILSNLSLKFPFPLSGANCSYLMFTSIFLCIVSFISPFFLQYAKNHQIIQLVILLSELVTFFI